MPPVPWSRGDEGQLEARDPESSLEPKRGGQGYYSRGLVSWNRWCSGPRSES